MAANGTSASAPEPEQVFTADERAAMDRVQLRPGHKNPNMARALLAFRQLNATEGRPLSQQALAGSKTRPNPIAKKLKGLPHATHANVATLEQGNCVKGASAETIDILARLTGHPREVFEELNKRDLELRVEAAPDAESDVAAEVLEAAAKEDTTPDQVEDRVPTPDELPQPADF